VVLDTTTTKLTAPLSALVGEQVVVNVTVTPDNSTPPPFPSGDVQLNYGLWMLGKHTLASGQTNFDNLYFQDPTDCVSVTAHYFGDGQFAPSDDGTCIEIDQADTDMELMSSPNPSLVGDLVTFTATVRVRPPGAGTPTGRVRFEEGGNLLEESNLNAAGQAFFTTESLSPGPHQITARYEGDVRYHASSATELQTVLSFGHGPVAFLEILAPSVVTVNAPFDLAVAAVDANLNVDPDYRGTITFAASDPTASLPAGYTFGDADPGTHSFRATLVTTGDQVIWAIDTADQTIFGSVLITVSDGAAPSSGQAPGHPRAWAAARFVPNNPVPPTANALPIAAQASTPAAPAEPPVGTPAPTAPSQRADENPVALIGPAPAAGAPDVLAMAAADALFGVDVLPSWPGALLGEPANQRRV
jgi:hypothetical protein